jgi:hypothetical protein
MRRSIISFWDNGSGFGPMFCQGLQYWKYKAYFISFSGSVWIVHVLGIRGIRITWMIYFTNDTLWDGKILAWLPPLVFSQISWFFNPMKWLQNWITTSGANCLVTCNYTYQSQSYFEVYVFDYVKCLIY